MEPGYAAAKNSTKGGSAKAEQTITNFRAQLMFLDNDPCVYV